MHFSSLFTLATFFLNKNYPGRKIMRQQLLTLISPLNISCGGFVSSEANDNRGCKLSYYDTLKNEVDDAKEVADEAFQNVKIMINLLEQLNKNDKERCDTILSKLYPLVKETPELFLRSSNLTNEVSEMAKWHKDLYLSKDRGNFYLPNLNVQVDKFLNLKAKAAIGIIRQTYSLYTKVHTQTLPIIRYSDIQTEYKDDLDDMKKRYTELYKLGKDLLVEFDKTSINSIKEASENVKMDKVTGNNKRLQIVENLKRAHEDLKKLVETGDKQHLELMKKVQDLHDASSNLRKIIGNERNYGSQRAMDREVDFAANQILFGISTLAYLSKTDIAKDKMSEDLGKLKEKMASYLERSEINESLKKSINMAFRKAKNAVKKLRIFLSEFIAAENYCQKIVDILDTIPELQIPIKYLFQSLFTPLSSKSTILWSSFYEIKDLMTCISNSLSGRKYYFSDSAEKMLNNVEEYLETAMMFDENIHCILSKIKELPNP